VVFTKLSGKYVEVSNYPGTTVDVSRGKWREHDLADTPGVYGLTKANDEECLAEAIIYDAQVIINVVDATRLRRDLFLTLQLLAREVPMLVVVNMMDEVRRQHAVPNLARLEQELGVPVLPAAAIRGEGMPALEAALSRLCFQAPAGRGRAAEDLTTLRAKANQVYSQAMEREEKEIRLTRLDTWLTRPLTGLITGVMVLAATWWVLGGLVADKVVAFTEGVVMNKWLAPLLVSGVQSLLPRGVLLEQLLAGDFGILTMALAYGVGLLLPLVFSFYLLLAVLEDSGYMPRLAVLLDNTFRPMGLNGKAVIPLILGFGCVTMAVVSTRVLSSRRERIILTFLLGLAVPCSAQTGITAMMLVPMGMGWLALYGLILLGVFLGAGILLNKAMPGKAAGLFLELPPMRLPRLGNMVRKAWAKTSAFLKDALPLFALGAALVTVLDFYGILAALEQGLAPLTRGWLNLPPQVIGSFIMGMIRRDFGTAGLHALGLYGAERFVALMTMTLFVPCLATVLVSIKEHGLAAGMAIWLGSLLTALAVGGLLAAVL